MNDQKKVSCRYTFPYRVYMEMIITIYVCFINTLCQYLRKSYAPAERFTSSEMCVYLLIIEINYIAQIHAYSKERCASIITKSLRNSFSHQNFKHFKIWHSIYVYIYVRCSRFHLKCTTVLNVISTKIIMCSVCPCPDIIHQSVYTIQPIPNTYLYYHSVWMCITGRKKIRLGAWNLRISNRNSFLSSFFFSK